MRRLSRPVVRRCLVIATFAGALSSDDRVWAQDRQKQVLVLYATRRDAQLVAVGDRDLPKLLERGSSQGVDYYSEFIDVGRFPSAEYKSAFRDFLRLKYSTQRFDLVIPMGDVPLAFAAANRHELFNAIPIVYFARNPSSRRLPNSTGVTTELDLTSTVNLAIALQPDTRRVFVVSGVDQSEGSFAFMARAQFRRFDSKLAFTYLAGVPTKELEARLASLPAQSIIYYLAVDRDAENEKFHPLDYVDRLAAVANRPIYCWVDSAMGHGIVGGSLLEQKALVDAVAALGVRVLRGEPAEEIQTAAPSLNVKQVDWRQLQRWNISEARIPAGTLVRFRDPSVWDRYRNYVVGALAILLAQTVLIAGLLVQRTRRRQAEERLRQHEEALRASYNRIRDLGARLLQAQETEHSRIAAELHDDISQQLTVLGIDLELLRRSGHDRREDVERLANQALDRAEEVASAVRDLSRRLHPANLRLIGLIAALAGLQREFSTADISVTFQHENVPRALPDDLTLCLFRIAQEAIQNAVRHSGARKVMIRLRGQGDALVLTVTDNGMGFDVTLARSGLGLISMSERAEHLGGTLQIRSTIGGGTRVAVSLPLVPGSESAVAAAAG